MNHPVLSEKLAWFKENEKPEVVLLIADDPQKMKLLIAWSNTDVSWKDDSLECVSDCENEIWQWLWDHAQYDPKEWQEKSGASPMGFDKRQQFLIGNRLIYPDGTMHSFVQKYLREKVLQLFQATGKVKKAKS
ncbi:MAG TPA: hypothetical protein PKW95_03520 [bacterium]|nr:hypothetical protein [bacterium]